MLLVLKVAQLYLNQQKRFYPDVVGPEGRLSWIEGLRTYVVRNP